MFTQEDTRLNVFFSRTCESKVRTACQVFPDKEWSGAAFYNVEYINGKNKDNASFNDIRINVLDFCLQDIGSKTYTEYDLNEDTASYIAKHIDTLLGAKVALLHSHNSMQAFLSGTDKDTFKEQAAQCNNTLSIVVNNDGPYVAVFAQKVKVNEKKDIYTNTSKVLEYSFIGESDRTGNDNYSDYDKQGDEYTEIHVFNCNVYRPENVEIDSAFMHRCIVKEKKLKELKDAGKLPVKDVIVGKEYNPLDDGFFGRKTFKEEFNETSYIDLLVNSILYLSFDRNACRGYSPEQNISSLYLWDSSPLPFPVEMEYASLYIDDFINIWKEVFKVTVGRAERVINRIASIKSLDENIKEDIIEIINTNIIAHDNY